MSNLWENREYTSPIDYIIDAPITEYDLSKANISILRDIGAIDEALYQRLFAAPKLEREIFIGNYQRDHKLSDALSVGIKEARKSLFSSLGLDETNVIEINNDSITLIKTPMMDYPDIVVVGEHTFFKKKGEYRSYYKINRNKKFFYLLDIVSGNEIMDVKGLGDYAIQMHENYMLSWMMYLFGLAITNGPRDALAECNRFYNLYINRQLDIGYYRRLDRQARFDMNRVFADWRNFQVDYLDSGPAEDQIEIGYNLSIIDWLAKVYIQEMQK